MTSAEAAATIRCVCLWALVAFAVATVDPAPAAFRAEEGRAARLAVHLLLNESRGVAVAAEQQSKAERTAGKEQAARLARKNRLAGRWAATLSTEASGRKMEQRAR
jgi:hypothetical protein